jgi:hypothetical protein
MTELNQQAPACNTPAPIIVDLITARRFRLLIDLDYSPELSADILNHPYLYHRIVGARDPGNGNPQREAA